MNSRPVRIVRNEAPQARGQELSIRRRLGLNDAPAGDKAGVAARLKRIAAEARARR